MRSVIFGAIILLLGCVLIARASMGDDSVRTFSNDQVLLARLSAVGLVAAPLVTGSVVAAPLANCWAYDADGFNYPVPGELKCFDTPSKAKAAALASCKKHSEKKASCHIVTCGWCGE